MDQRVYILDEITVKPGVCQQYQALYRDEYMPEARRRGMRLEGAWQHPPVEEFAGHATTLYYLWSVEDVPAWWAMRLSRSPDGTDERLAKLAWWQKNDALTERRERKFLSALPEAG
ncbi:hypothetical protein [Haliea sp. E17]|uniref:hypothetical protein n=1 Tax=Haliea sp. E17 TaxID=3401576 RepID=UPI003AAC7E6F